MMFSAGYATTTIDVIIQFALIIMAGITLLWVTWHRIFAYSPDKRYRMNRYMGIAEEQKTLNYEPSPAPGGVIVWNPLGKITRRQFILEKWARNTNVEINAYIDE